MNQEELEQERKASLERRSQAAVRRRKPTTDWVQTKALTRAQKLKLRDDDFVPPQD